MKLISKFILTTPFKFLNLIFVFFWCFSIKAEKLSEDYCIGYLEEVYWALDTIEEEDSRITIASFFNKKFLGADQLDFNLYYKSSNKQFIINDTNIDLSQFIEVNYPNFEIILLDAYINLFKKDENYCPAFWNQCSDESLENFFLGAKEFSKTWTNEESVLSFLEKDFMSNQCVAFLRTNIDKEKFIKDLNILINQLTN